MIRERWYGFFKADNGQLSMSRLVLFFIVLCLMEIEIFVAVQTKSIPYLVEWLAFAASIYGVNKFGTKVERTTPE